MFHWLIAAIDQSYYFPPKNVRGNFCPFSLSSLVFSSRFSLSFRGLVFSAIECNERFFFLCPPFFGHISWLWIGDMWSLEICASRSVHEWVQLRYRHAVGLFFVRKTVAPFFCSWVVRFLYLLIAPFCSECISGMSLWGLIQLLIFKFLPFYVK